MRQLADALSTERQVHVIGKGVCGLSQAAGMEVYATDRHRYLQEALGQLRRLRPAWVQVENRPTFLPQVKAACPDAKVILSLHSDRFLLPPYLSQEKRSYLLSACDKVLTNSLFLKKRLLQWVPELGEQVVVLPLGVDLARFLPRENPISQKRREQMRERWGVKKSEPLLLFVGRWIPQKGLHHLLQAMETIRRQHPTARLAIIGGSHYGRNLLTPYVRRLKRMANPLGKAIIWVPFIPHIQMMQCYAAADLLVVPSTGSEAFGLVNLEGMASSLPVVSVRTGGIPEVIEHEETGLLVDAKSQHLPQALAAACCKLLSDPERMEQMGQRGRERVERYFHWERIAAEWDKMFPQ